jgi:hypothetical protein
MIKMRPTGRSITTARIRMASCQARESLLWADCMINNTPGRRARGAYFSQERKCPRSAGPPPDRTA